MKLWMPLFLAWLAIVLPVREILALDFGDIEGPWRTPSMTVLEIARGAAAGPGLPPQDGRLVDVSVGDIQIGYGLDQIFARDIQIVDDVVRFDLAFRSIDPIKAKECGAVWVPFEGRYEESADGQVSLKGRHKSVFIDLPWQAGDPCDIRVEEGWTEFLLNRVPRRQYALENLEIVGLFHCQRRDQEPPFAPYAEISVDGHFIVSLDQGFFPQTGPAPGKRSEGNVTVQLLATDTNFSWQPLDTPVPAKLSRCMHPSYLDGYGRSERNDPSLIMRMPEKAIIDVDESARFLPANLDESIAGFWEQLGEGDRDRLYRFEVKAATTGAATGFTFNSPIFSKDEIYRALQARLEDLTWRLFHWPLSEFQQRYSLVDSSGANLTDYEGAKESIWRGIAFAGRQLHANVEVINFSTHNDRLEVALVLEAHFSDGRTVELDRQDVVLGASREDDVALFRAAEGRRVIVNFQPVSLSQTGPLKPGADLTHISVRALPAWAGRVGKGAASEKINGAALKDIAPIIAFAERIGGPENAVTAARARVAGIRRPGETDRWMEYAYNSLDIYAEALFEEFVRLHRLHLAFYHLTGGTRLDRLDRLVRGYWQNGNRQLQFRSPLADRALVDANPNNNPPELQGSEFRLSQSINNQRLSFYSALLNPNLSFAMDPSLFPLLEGKVNAVVAGNRIRGMTNWAFPSQGLDENFALRQFDSVPAMQEAYRQLTGGRGAHEGLSPEAARRLRNGDFEAVKGQIFEEICITPKLMEEAVRLGQSTDSSGKRLYSDIVAVSGSQLYGLGIPGLKTKSGLLTDGLILGKRDGRWQILRIAEAKAGDTGAQGLFDQFHKDAFRLENSRLRLQNLTQQQASVLGITGTSLEFDRVGAPGGLLADFSDQRLYMPFVVSDADIRLPSAPKFGVRPHTLQIRRAMEEGLVRANLTQEHVESLTDLLFKQARIQPVAWHERHLDYESFRRVTKRSLGDRPMPADSVLQEKFANGERVVPDTDEWVSVFEEWERPVRSADQVYGHAVRHWKMRHNDEEPTAKQKETWRRDANAGKRFNPDSNRGAGSWAGSDTLQKKYYSFMLHSDDPTLSEDEMRIWLRFSGQIPEAEREAFFRRWQAGQETFSTDDRSWRRWDEKELGKRAMARDPENFTNGFNARRANAELAGDVAERMVAAIAEESRISREELIVTVYHDDTNVYVHVEPKVVYQNGREALLAIPSEQQKGLLKQYYRYSENMFWGRDVPPWLAR